MAVNNDEEIQDAEDFQEDYEHLIRELKREHGVDVELVMGISEEGDNWYPSIRDKYKKYIEITGNARDTPKE